MKKSTMGIIAVVAVVAMAGCSLLETPELYNALKQGEDIEVQVYAEGKTAGETNYTFEEAQVNLFHKTTHETERELIDALFGVKEVDFTDGEHGKIGCLYVNSKNIGSEYVSFVDALRNKVFNERLAEEGVQQELARIGSSAYSDVDADKYGLEAAFNAYYGLLGDEVDRETGVIKFNPEGILTRGEFYSFIGRADSCVADWDEHLPNPDITEGYERLRVYAEVGEDGWDMVAPAAAYEQYAYLNSKTGLTSNTYNGAISKIEAIYMLMNLKEMEEYMGVPEFNGENEFIDLRDGGRMLEDSIESIRVSNELEVEDPDPTVPAGTKKAMDGYAHGVLIRMFNTTGVGVSEADRGKAPTELYRAMVMAKELGIVGEDSRYDVPITRAEAINLFMQVQQARTERSDYYSKTESGKELHMDRKVAAANEAAAPEPVYMYDAELNEFVQVGIKEASSGEASGSGSGGASGSAGSGAGSSSSSVSQVQSSVRSTVSEDEAARAQAIRIGKRMGLSEEEALAMLTTQEEVDAHKGTVTGYDKAGAAMDAATVKWKG